VEVVRADGLDGVGVDHFEATRMTLKDPSPCLRSKMFVSML